MRTLEEIKEWLIDNGSKPGLNKFIIYLLSGDVSEINPEIIPLIKKSKMADKNDLITFLSGGHISVSKIKKLLKGRKLYGKYRRDVATNERGFRTYTGSRYKGHISDSYKDLFRLSGTDNSGMDITWMYMYEETCSPYILESIHFKDEEEYEYIIFDADKVELLMTLMLNIWEECINYRVEAETEDDIISTEAYLLMSINNITDIKKAIDESFDLSEIPQILARVSNEAIIGRYDTYTEMMNELRK